MTDHSLDASILDLEAVVDRLRLESFALMGLFFSGPVAIAYAARHPEQVSHLILWGTWARGSDYFEVPRVQASHSLIDKDWEYYTESAAQGWYDWSAGEEAHRAAAFIREAVTPEGLQATLEAMSGFDVTALLSQVRSPTLVLHRRQAAYPSLDVARRLASGIPDARLALLDGSGLTPHIGDPEPVASAIDEFLGEGEPAAAASYAPEAGTVHTILFTDMQGSTALTQRLGDAKAQDLVRTHNTIVRDALKSHGGSEVKHTGDGIMASFQSASQALQCAIAIQQAVAAQGDTRLRVRIGLNAGEPVAEEQDLFGTAVQLAKRACDRAEPGEILVSNVVRELAAGKGFLFADHGDVELRGFEDPVRLFEALWET